MQGFLGIEILVSMSAKKSGVISSCSALLFTAASTFPPEGAGEECAESAGRGDTLSRRFTLPVLALSASSSSSSLDRTTETHGGSHYYLHWDTHTTTNMENKVYPPNS